MIFNGIEPCGEQSRMVPRVFYLGKPDGGSAQLGRPALRALALAAQPIALPMEQMNAVWALAGYNSADRFLFHKPPRATGGSGRRAVSRTAAGWRLQCTRTPTRPTPLVDVLHRITATPLLVGSPPAMLALIWNATSPPASQARLLTQGNSAHSPEIEEPEAYAAAVRGFLAKR
jgi:pimeloyl-ACP methyl ester carboxylesterase